MHVAPHTRQESEHHAPPQVDRSPPPPLPGGFKVGDTVYFTGTSQDFPSGNRLEPGKQGEVMGPATLESHKGKGVEVKFPGNTGTVDCYLTTVRSRPPITACFATARRVRSHSLRACGRMHVAPRVRAPRV